MNFQNPEELADLVFCELTEDENGPLDRKELVEVFNAAFEEIGETVTQDDIDEPWKYRNRK